MKSKRHPVHTYLTVYEDGRMYSDKTNKFIKHTPKEDGYLLCWVGGKLQRVHRVVAETFLTNSETYGLDVNHIDGNKKNNHISNLEWCTRSHNIRHAHTLGLNKCRLENHFNAIYTNEFVHSVCKRMEEGYRNIDIVREFNVTKDWISSVRTGKLWSEISSNYAVNPRRNIRLSKATVLKICRLLEEGVSVTRLTTPPYNFAKVTVERILKRETYSDLSKGFKF